MAAYDSVDAAQPFDYCAAAEQFPPRGGKFGHKSNRYRRFERAADAIRFAIEELPPQLLLAACVEVEELRYDGAGIRRLYDSTEYPLARRAAA